MRQHEARVSAYAKLEELEDGPSTHPVDGGERQVSWCGLALPLNVAAHRIGICALAIALLWATSLSVSRRLTSSFVAAPSFGTVVRECRRAYTEVQRQREAHISCTARQLSRCDQRLEAA